MAIIKLVNFCYLALFLKYFLYVCINQIVLMTKNYFYIILLFVCFTASNAVAQEGKSASRSQDNTIEGLSFYPNPVSNGKVYITSKSNADKQVTIFDVLGKKVLQTQLTSKELNVASLSPGVYIIKIEEGDASATRKLIVR